MFATGATLPAVSHASAASDTPQFAQFRVSKKGAQSGNDDALPAMPSWEGSESKKVLVEEESVEMSDLKRPEAIGANQGLAAGLHLVSPNPSPGPHNPYSRPGSTAGSTGYFATPSAASDRYGQTAQGYGPGYSPEGQGYRQSSSPYGNQRVQGYHVNPGYGAAVVVGAAMGQSYGEQGGYGQTGTPDGYGRTRQSGYDSQGQQREAGYGSAPRRSAASPAGHGYAGHYEQNRPYAGAAPERQYSSDSMRPLRPTVSTQQRQYSDDSQAVSSPFSHVSGGFDFSTDDSRSVAQSTRGARGYAGRPSLSREQTQAAAYNGYRMY